MRVLGCQSSQKTSESKMMRVVATSMLSQGKLSGKAVNASKEIDLAEQIALKCDQAIADLSRESAFANLTVMMHKTLMSKVEGRFTGYLVAAYSRDIENSESRGI